MTCELAVSFLTLHQMSIYIADTHTHTQTYIHVRIDTATLLPFHPLCAQPRLFQDLRFTIAKQEEKRA